MKKNFLPLSKMSINLDILETSEIKIPIIIMFSILGCVYQ